MKAALGHICRYLSWAAAGAVLIVTFGYVFLELTTADYDIDAGHLLVVCVVGADVLLLLRLLVGLATRWPPRAADRATAFGLLRCFIGWLLGYRAGISFIALLDPQLLVGWRSLPQEWPWLVVQVFALAGAASLTATGWMLNRRWGWLIVPNAWAAGLIVFVGLWAAVSPPLRESLIGIARGEQFAGGKRVPAQNAD